MPVALNVVGRELKAFQQDLKRYNDIEGIALARASRDALKKVRTQMIKDVSKDIAIATTPVRARFGKRIFLDKDGNNRFTASLGLATKYKIPVAYAKNVRDRRPAGVKAVGHHYPHAFLIESVDPRKKRGAVVQRETVSRYPIKDVTVDFINESDTAFQKSGKIADDSVDARYHYWRERLYSQFNKKNNSGSKSSFIQSLFTSGL